MIQDLLGVDLIAFGKNFGTIALFNLIFIAIWFIVFRFTAKFIKDAIEKAKDKEIERLVEMRNEYHKIFMGEYLLTTKKKAIKKK